MILIDCNDDIVSWRQGDMSYIARSRQCFFVILRFYWFGSSHHSFSLRVERQVDMLMREVSDELWELS